MAKTRLWTESWREAEAWIGHRVEVPWPNRTPTAVDVWLPGTVVGATVAYGQISLQVEVGATEPIWTRRYRLPAREDSLPG